MNEESLRFLITDREEVVMKGALPLPSLGSLSERIVELSTNAARTSMSKALSNMMSTLSSIELENSSLSVSQIKFTLILDASGEFSIASVATGSLSGQTGIEFTMERKAQ